MKADPTRWDPALPISPQRTVMSSLVSFPVIGLQPVYDNQPELHHQLFQQQQQQHQHQQQQQQQHQLQYPKFQNTNPQQQDGHPTPQLFQSSLAISSPSTSASSQEYHHQLHYHGQSHYQQQENDEKRIHDLQNLVNRLAAEQEHQKNKLAGFQAMMNDFEQDISSYRKEVRYRGAEIDILRKAINAKNKQEVLSDRAFGDNEELKNIHRVPVRGGNGEYTNWEDGVNGNENSNIIFRNRTNVENTTMGNSSRNSIAISNSSNDHRMSRKEEMMRKTRIDSDGTTGSSVSSPLSKSTTFDHEMTPTATVVATSSSVTNRSTSPGGLGSSFQGMDVNDSSNDYSSSSSRSPAATDLAAKEDNLAARNKNGGGGAKPLRFAPLRTGVLVAVFNNPKNTNKSPPSRRALIVDDDAIYRKIVSAYLTRLNFKCETAVTGSEAVKKCLQIIDVDDDNSSSSSLSSSGDSSNDDNSSRASSVISEENSTDNNATFHRSLSSTQLPFHEQSDFTATETDVANISSSSSSSSTLADAKNPYDLIVMDIMLPSLNGLQATKKIRERFPDSAIIALTCVVIAEADRGTYRDVGMADLLNKPLSFHDLIECVERIVGIGFRAWVEVEVPSFFSFPFTISFSGMDDFDNSYSTNSLFDKDDYDDDDDDAYSSLAQSERIGTVTLDWRALPSSIRASVPGAPSAIKQNAIIRRMNLQPQLQLNNSKPQYNKYSDSKNNSSNGNAGNNDNDTNANSNNNNNRNTNNYKNSVMSLISNFEQPLTVSTPIPVRNSATSWQRKLELSNLSLTSVESVDPQVKLNPNSVNLAISSEKRYLNRSKEATAESLLSNFLDGYDNDDYAANDITTDNKTISGLQQQQQPVLNVHLGKENFDSTTPLSAQPSTQEHYFASTATRLNYPQATKLQVKTLDFASDIGFRRFEEDTKRLLASDESIWNLTSAEDPNEENDIMASANIGVTGPMPLSSAFKQKQDEIRKAVGLSESEEYLNKFLSARASLATQSKSPLKNTRVSFPDEAVAELESSREKKSTSMSSFSTSMATPTSIRPEFNSKTSSNMALQSSTLFSEMN
ncbi:hypothetical protein HK100_008861 [Physocladia obscura]|uniref:Response regulatory domain-containing protein n=1 Tax=Physocladia obscura TaxID=109957 RepID=A0AAD5T9B6_9FUNG|nr:hypothetical protein HK100_008861 [Physocladia obscura]